MVVRWKVAHFDFTQISWVKSTVAYLLSRLVRNHLEEITPPEELEGLNWDPCPLESKILRSGNKACQGRASYIAGITPNHGKNDKDSSPKGKWGAGGGSSRSLTTHKYRETNDLLSKAGRLSDVYRPSSDNFVPSVERNNQFFSQMHHDTNWSILQNHSSPSLVSHLLDPNSVGQQSRKKPSLSSVPFVNSNIY